MAIIISIGKWGGVYFYHGFGWRLCLGWIAISYFPVDGDVILEAARKYVDIKYPETEVKEESVDIILTSPPYNVKLPYEDYEDNLPEDEFRDLIKNFLSEAYRVCAESSRMYCVLGDKIIWWFKPMAEDAGFRFVQKLTWCKSNLVGGSGKITGDWNYMTEDILLFLKGKRTPMLNGGDDTTTFNWLVEAVPQSNFKAGRVHIAQFPYRLCKRILARTPGNVVLDPFCGSGQVLRAARALGREAIGIEIGKNTIRKSYDFVMNHHIKQDDTQSAMDIDL